MTTYRPLPRQKEWGKWETDFSVEFFIFSLIRKRQKEFIEIFHSLHLGGRGFANFDRLRGISGYAPSQAGANHALKVVPSDDREANTAAYADPDLALAAGVTDATLAFICSTAKIA
jgi:hypothetical protein